MPFSHGKYFISCPKILQQMPVSGCTMEGPPPQGAPTNCHSFYHAVLTSERWENVYKPQVSCRPTCNVYITLRYDRRIPIQYPSCQ